MIFIQKKNNLKKEEKRERDIGIIRGNMLTIGVCEFSVNSELSCETSKLKSINSNISSKEKELVKLKEEKRELEKKISSLKTVKDNLKKYKFVKKVKKATS